MPSSGSVLQDKLLWGDSAAILPTILSATVDMIITDPPYLVDYRKPNGTKAYPNDDPAKPGWLPRICREMYRVLRPDSLCLSFYGWPAVDIFMCAWREAGFRPVSHMVFRKEHDSRQGFTIGRHEAAFLLAKGRPPRPHRPVPDVLPWGKHTGNRLHPCQKPVAMFTPLIEAFSRPGEVILDPFAGSGTVPAAAKSLGRHYIGVEVVSDYYHIAWQRLHG